MMYESDEDYIRSYIIGHHLAEALGLQWHHYPRVVEGADTKIRYGGDGWLSDETVPIAVCETKDRHTIRHDYSTYMIGARKLRGLLDEAYRFGICRAMLAVRWREGRILYREIGNSESLPVPRMAGRTKQTRRPSDVEPCVFLPMSGFVEIGAIAEDDMVQRVAALKALWYPTNLSAGRERKEK